MSGFQYVHVEAYARTAGKGKAGAHCIATIMAEADRVPSACPHILQAVAPTILFGCSIKQVGEAAESWASHARDACGRKLRKDGLCVAAGVVSFPRSRESDWPAFRTATVIWLKKKYGDRLLSVVEHTDEEHPHLHFFLVPLEGENFDVIHQGRAAANAIRKAGGLKGAQNKAYIQAMKNFQNEFFESVAVAFGLARIGPRRRRLTRREWKIEQELAIDRAEHIERWSQRLKRSEDAFTDVKKVLDLFTPNEIMEKRSLARIVEIETKGRIPLGRGLHELRKKMGFIPASTKNDEQFIGQIQNSSNNDIEIDSQKIPLAPHDKFLNNKP
jgi:hypothetical protein